MMMVMMNDTYIDYILILLSYMLYNCSRLVAVLHNLPGVPSMLPLPCSLPSVSSPGLAVSPNPKKPPNICVVPHRLNSSREATIEPEFRRKTPTINFHGFVRDLAKAVHNFLLSESYVQLTTMPFLYLFCLIKTIS